MLRKSRQFSSSRNENNMSIQKVAEQKKQFQSKSEVKEVISSVSSQRIHFSARQAWGDKADETLLWKTLLNQPARLRKRHIVFRNVQYIYAGWTGTGYPQIVYLTLDQFPGYVDQTMAQTDRVAALQLSSAQAMIDQSGVKTYELKYVIRDSVTWELPIALVDLKLRVQIQGANVQLPLINPMTLNIQIRSQFN